MDVFVYLFIYFNTQFKLAKFIIIILVRMKESQNIIKKKEFFVLIKFNFKLIMKTQKKSHSIIKKNL